MDLFLARPMMHAFGAKSRIVTGNVNQTPWLVAGRDGRGLCKFLCRNRDADLA